MLQAWAGGAMLQRETGTENGVVIILSLAKGNKYGNVK
jgi:hypothetical protein